MLIWSQEIKAQFMDLLADAAAGKLDPWIE
jgi:hypothetical protein